MHYVSLGGFAKIVLEPAALVKYVELKSLSKCMSEYQDNKKRSLSKRYSIAHFLMNQDYDDILNTLL